MNINTKKGFVINEMINLDKILIISSINFAKFCDGRTDFDIKDSDVSNAVGFFRERGYEMHYKLDGLKRIYTINPGDLAKIDIDMVVSKAKTTGKRRTPMEINIDNMILKLQSQIDALMLLRNSNVDINGLLNGN